MTLQNVLLFQLWNNIATTKHVRCWVSLKNNLLQALEYRDRTGLILGILEKGTRVSAGFQDSQYPSGKESRSHAQTTDKLGGHQAAPRTGRAT